VFFAAWIWGRRCARSVGVNEDWRGCGCGCGGDRSGSGSRSGGGGRCGKGIEEVSITFHTDTFSHGSDLDWCGTERMSEGCTKINRPC